MTQTTQAVAAGRGFSPESFSHLVGIEERSFWFAGRNRLITVAMERYFPQATSFLEVGCGTGYVLLGLQAARPSLTLCGSELFEEGLEFARARLPGARLLQADARALPFHEEFDVAGAFDVLEHIDDDERALASMRDAIRPGGGVLITVPQHPRLWSPADDYAEHQRRYTRRELREKLDRAGFRVLRMTSFVTAALPAMVVSRARQRHDSAPYDPTAEHRAAERLAKPLGAALAAETWLIQHGVTFPVGGSLLAVAQR